jgi:hypothetical protein
MGDVRIRAIEVCDTLERDALTEVRFERINPHAHEADLCPFFVRAGICAQGVCLPGEIDTTSLPQDS